MTLFIMLIMDLIVGAIAGYLAAGLMKVDNSNIVQNCFLGILGGIVGTLVGSLIGLKATGYIGNLIFAVIGAVIVIYVYQKFIKK